MNGENAARSLDALSISPHVSFEPMTATIRMAGEADAEQVGAIYAPYVRETAISFEVEPPTTEEMGARIARMTRRYPWLVCTRDAEILGYAYASQHRERAAYQWSVDVSVYIDRRAWRRGIGQALYRALLRIITLQGFYNAYAGITLPNAGSVGLHEAVGFRPVGVYHAVGYKLGAWHDVGWWHLALRQPALAPALPVDLEAVRASADWDEAVAAGLRWLRQ